MSRHLMRAGLILALIAMPWISSPAHAGAAQRNAAMFEKALAQQLELAKLEQAKAQDQAQAQAQADVAMINACASAADPSMCIMYLDNNRTMRTIMGALGVALGTNNAAKAVAPPYERDGAAKFRDAMTMPFQMIMGGMGMLKDYKLAQIGQESQAQQYGFLGGVLTQALQANAGVSQAAIANAQPNYNVSGVLVQGDQHIGDTVTGDGNATHGSHIGDDIEGEAIATHGGQIGDATTITGNENAVDGVIDNHVVDVRGTQIIGSSGVNTENGEGDQRIESPGPIDNSDPGDDCTGSDCSNEPPADPDPPGGP